LVDNGWIFRFIFCPVDEVMNFVNDNKAVIEVDLHMADEDMKEEFTLADRSHLRYKVLLGINVLEKRFLIDPSIKIVNNQK